MSRAGTAGATAPSANIRTNPARARRVIAQSRQEFVARYPDLKFSPVVGLICAYDEEDNIGAVLRAMPADACGLPVSTLVIVDGGNDHTDRVALEAGATTFVLSENLGHGYALRVGYALAIEFGAQFVVTLDADGQNDPVEIPVMLQPLIDDEADFVVGSRRQGGRAGLLLGHEPAGRDQADRHLERLPRPTGADARRRRPPADRVAVPDGGVADGVPQAGLAGDRAADALAPPLIGYDEEGQELPLRPALRAGGALHLVARACGSNSSEFVAPQRS